MADLVVAAMHQATDLFGEPIEAHPPWFKPEAFLRADFDPDVYVTDLRSYVPLDSLVAELRSNLAALRAELVGLINRDYADFVDLSARLKGVDVAAARMRAPRSLFVQGGGRSGWVVLKVGFGTLRYYCDYCDTYLTHDSDMITAGMDTTVISVEWAKEAARGAGPCRWP
ncbi:hypothetical protein GUJ93_ZPchr0005g15061 [Zizania palustris]|uniref:Conserved oligomeric Golgi complex subunit 2 n=1 Tax=Zizania palustris TaxID=103762 RepID=A0A8J5S524_ZIZPA|nr:hypothetical protein GUJ93_ZPchr0002g25174 [Zizania palustris]KAG8069215.1 hypothetical protein GUJ93_ZPchr0005g15061 [Zizania palustris]